MRFIPPFGQRIVLLSRCLPLEDDFPFHIVDQGLPFSCSEVRAISSRVDGHGVNNCPFSLSLLSPFALPSLQGIFRIVYNPVNGGFLVDHEGVPPFYRSHYSAEGNTRIYGRI